MFQVGLFHHPRFFSLSLLHYRLSSPRFVHLEKAASAWIVHFFEGEDRLTVPRKECNLTHLSDSSVAEWRVMVHFNDATVTFLNMVFVTCGMQRSNLQISGVFSCTEREFKKKNLKKFYFWKDFVPFCTNLSECWNLRRSTCSENFQHTGGLKCLRASVYPPHITIWPQVSLPKKRARKKSRVIFFLSQGSLARADSKKGISQYCLLPFFQGHWLQGGRMFLLCSTSFLLPPPPPLVVHCIACLVSSLLPLLLLRYYDDPLLLLLLHWSNPSL